MIDDILVPYMFHGVADLAILPALMINQFEMIPGGFSAHYGNATGGIVRLATPTEIPDKAVTEFTVNAPYYSGVVTERPIDANSAVTVGVRRSYLDYVTKDYYKEEQSSTQATNAAQVAKFSDGQASICTRATAAPTRSRPWSPTTTRS